MFSPPPPPPTAESFGVSAQIGSARAAGWCELLGISPELISVYPFVGQGYFSFLANVSFVMEAGGMC